ncbi:hypothetical protein BHE74_00017109 [Ensete ventricosum]|nr:hypothetical protein BHE74_00017109 [Ensete ventricosum]
MHRLGISKYWTIPTYYPMGSRTSTVLLKNTTVINFAQRLVSIDFFVQCFRISKYWPFPKY